MLRADNIAHEAVKKFGDNAGFTSFEGQVFRKVLGMEGHRAKEERANELMAFLTERIETTESAQPGHQQNML